jgi:hypothetical protein
MGISGNILSAKSLRKLNRDFDMDFDRAYRRNQEGEARKMVDGRCVHFRLDFRDKTARVLPEDEIGAHWSTCFASRGDWKLVDRIERVGNHMVPVYERIAV